MDKIIKNCNFCNSNKLKVIFKMPNFPLTGIYLSSKNKKLKKFNNEFCICPNCNHGQLKKQVNPNLLYDKTYTHRTGESISASSSNDEFLKNIIQITKKKFTNILEVGCNDLHLTKKLTRLSKQKVFGIDPIWKNKSFHHNKIKLTGGFIDDINDFKDLKHSIGEAKIDLVVSSHTFEHVGDFFNSMKKITDLVDNNCMFVIETPSLDSIIRLNRFDQIFHQHLHYPSENSFLYLINKLGCEYVGHKYNYRVWGGNVTFWFKKNRKNKKILKFKNKINLNDIKKKFFSFKTDLPKKINFLKDQNKKISGFGAAQMLPILAYYGKTNFKFMKYLFDDDPRRQNKYLPLINKKITKTKIKYIKNHFVLITGLDSSRSIIKKLIEMNPKRILSIIDNF
jgi:2-polyprenyl-3-methyl-5-hydroxy-6-metoxy-1,4-benzoquinol methylase